MSAWETLVNDGIEARKRGDGAAWELGDLACRVETRYGEGDLQKYADRIGVAYRTLVDYRGVATRFSERSEKLTWSHHQVVASRDDAEEWLGRAEREGWSVARLRRKLAPAHVAHNSIEKLQPAVALAWEWGDRLGRASCFHAVVQFEDYCRTLGPAAAEIHLRSAWEAGRLLRELRPTADAFQAIRDDGLYRATHATFEDYCRERWGLEPELVDVVMVAVRAASC